MTFYKPAFGFIMLRFINNSSKRIKFEKIDERGNCKPASELAAGQEYYEQTNLRYSFAIRDAATGVVHAVFQQNKDYKNKKEYPVRVNEDANGNLTLDYEPAPEVGEYEDSPEEDLPDLDDYDMDED